MKQCLQCSQAFSGGSWTCPTCGFAPALLDGLPAFAPELARLNDGFAESIYADQFALEVTNFWFRARSRLVNWALRRYFPSMKNYLEIGCGNGYMLAQVEKDFAELEMSGSEIFTAGLSFTKRRISNATLMQMDAGAIPFTEEFDAIGAFDVIEHIDDDHRVLAQMYKAVRPAGGIVLTVPQHRWLWSYVDEYAHHKRRYTKAELKQKVEEAGFTVLRMSSFVSFLVPLMYLSRMRNLKKRESYDDTEELRVNQFVNFVMERIMDIERLLISWGVTLPIGGSLLLVARRPMPIT